MNLVLRDAQHEEIGLKPAQLERFEAFCDLDEPTKLLACKQVSQHIAQYKDLLFRHGDVDDIEYFLLEGTIELEAADGRNKVVDANEATAQFPLALLRPRKFSAKVTSDRAVLLTVPVNTLANLRLTVPVAGDAFSFFSPFHDPSKEAKEASSPEEAARQFLLNCNQAIVANRLLISSFDNISSTIYDALQDPEADLATIIGAVQLDAAISAKILKAANSAFFGGMAKADSVRSAVVRLGLDMSVQLVTMMVVKEVFKSDKVELRHAMHRIWQSSLKLATCALVVGRRSSCRFQQGQLLLAGLMHEVGALAIIAYLDQFPAMVDMIGEQVLDSDYANKKVGLTLLKHWQFPGAVIEAVEQSDELYRKAEYADLCDVICVARLILRMAAYRKLPVSDPSIVPAFKRLGFDTTDPNLLDDIIQEANACFSLFGGAFES